MTGRITDLLNRGIALYRQHTGEYPPNIRMTKDRVDQLKRELMDGYAVELPGDDILLETFMGIPIIVEDADGQKDHA